MKNKVIHYKHGVSKGNIIFPKKYPMSGGKFPNDHPFSDCPDPLLFKGDVHKASFNRLSNFRDAGYEASCFPEGDGIYFVPRKGQSEEQVEKDIREFLGLII